MMRGVLSPRADLRRCDMRHCFHRIATISGILAVTCSHVSCATTGANGVRADNDGARSSSASRSSSAFGFNLYRELLAQRPGENIFVSPASVGFALAMTYNGAQGTTMEAMANVLGLGGKGLEESNRADSVLISATRAPMKGIELSVANSLWGRKGIDFNKDFLARNKRYYGADVRSIDFASPQAAPQINAWVAEKTKDKIQGIVDQIDEGSILFLINAIYFKGTWTKEFDKRETREKPFYLPGGKEKTCPMMSQGSDYLYLKGDGFQAAAIPYGEGRMSMYVFLPDDRMGLDKLHARLSDRNWDAWIGSFAKRPGRIGLPRFKLEFKAKLKSALTNLGMGIAFEGARANFRGMITGAGGNAYIEDVVHKTFVEVNEKGTEAAAATAVEMKLTSVMEPQRPFEMICDHPFFFAIRDNETGLVLFMGSIVDPEQ
jgi:serine protease inhibitor